MKLLVVGTGDGGSAVADELANANQWAWDNRGFGIASGTRDKADIFAVNLADLFSLKHIPMTEDHSIQIGAANGFIGRGAGKVNRDGAEQARQNSSRIVNTIGENSDVYSADAILVIATTAGGTGSGSIGVIASLLQKEFSKPTFPMVILPFSNQYNELDTVLNTATCLRSIFPSEASESVGDAQLILDNQKFVLPQDPIGINYNLINRRITEALFEICCVGQETNPKYIGEQLDSNDLIRALKGACVIGSSTVDVADHHSGTLVSRGLGMLSRNTPRHHTDSRVDIERAQSVIRQTLTNFSADVGFHASGGGTQYDCEYAIWLLSGPPETMTTEVLDTIDNTMALQAPEARRRRGTYPGRRRDLNLTAILSNIGSGALLNKVQFFYEAALKLAEKTEDRNSTRTSKWADVAKSGDGLPSL